MSQFFTHIRDDGSKCLATMIDGEKVLIDKQQEVEFYKDIKERAQAKRQKREKPDKLDTLDKPKPTKV